MSGFRSDDFLSFSHVLFSVSMTAFFLLVVYLILILVKKNMSNEVGKKAIKIEERKSISGFGQVVLLSVHERHFLMVSSKGAVAISILPSAKELEEKINKIESENAG